MIDRGVDHCGTNTTSVYLSTSAEQGFRVVMTWDTPGDPNQTDDMGTDLDLHLLHPQAPSWNHSVYDCYFANRAPDWGNLGAENNPSLDIDDVNGAGPEQISYQDPEERNDLYRIGVHYYSSGMLFDRRSEHSKHLCLLPRRVSLHHIQGTPQRGHSWEPAAIRWGDQRGGRE